MQGSADLCGVGRAADSVRLMPSWQAWHIQGTPIKLHPIGRESFKYDSTLHHTMLMQLSHWSYVINWFVWSYSVQFRLSRIASISNSVPFRFSSPMV